MLVNTTLDRRRAGFSPRAQRQKGLSIIELMVGMTVGLIISGMAGFYLIGVIQENKRLMVEIRLMQDLRGAMDVISRDIRRAGYWENAAAGVASVNPTGFTRYSTVPYTTVTQSAGLIEYAYSRDNDNAVNSSTEAFGFKLEGGIIKSKLGGTYQELTDPGVTNVSTFTITPSTLLVPIECVTVCNLSDATCPRITIRSYNITATGSSVGTSTADTVTRTLSTNVRVRNDVPSGACSAS